jgi:LCP family protein required for cell wall assembly
VRRRAGRHQRHLSWPAFTSLLLVSLLLSGICGAVAYFLPVAQAAYAQTGQSVKVGAVPSTIPAAGAAPVSPGRAFTVLLLGSDDDSKFQTDAVLTQSMILVRVDPVAKHVTMLSIARDLWVPLSSGGTAKIDAAYSYGGAANAIATVEHNFGVHIDDWAWVGLRGLVKLIDYMGGVDVTATNPVLDDFYPADLDSTDPYAYKRVAVLPGPQHLSGHDALEYVRSRHGDLLSDFGRSQRQQQILLALRSKARGINPTDLPNLVASFNGEFKTSISPTDLGRIRSMLALANQITDPAQIEQIVLVGAYTSPGNRDGQDVLLPHWDLILPLVHQHFP